MKFYKNLIIFLAIVFHHTTYAAFSDSEDFGLILMGLFGILCLSLFLSLIAVSKFIEFCLFFFYKKDTKARSSLVNILIGAITILISIPVAAIFMYVIVKIVEYILSLL